MTRKLLLPLLALCALALPARTQAQTTVPNGFSHVVVFTVDGYAANRSALADFPVLVRISEAGISGFDYDDMTSPTTGDDLCFFAADGTPLAFDIDTWDPSGTSLVWARLPSMANGTQFVMAYGSSASGKTVCSANAFAGYTGVWHMNEAAAGVTTIHDATTNALDGTTVSSSSSKTDGKVGRARFITSNKTNTAGQPYDSGVTVALTDSAEKLAAVDALVPEFTASFWVRPQSDAQWWYFISRKTADKEPGWGLQNGSTQNNSGQANFKTFRAYGGSEDESACLSLYGVDALVKQKWVKIDAVWMADKRFLLYVDGQKASEGTLANAAANTASPLDLSLGGAMAPLSTSNKNGRGVYGDMDEVRLRAGAMTADWIAADYATQADEAFLSASAAADAVALWFDEDGVTPLSPAFTAVSDGTRPVRADPAKSTVFYDFVFQGWTPVGGDGTVFAASELPVQTTGSIAAYKAVWQSTPSARVPDGFSRGIPFTVSGYEASRSTLADFPVLVRISEAGIPGFDYDDMMFPANGDDLCFVANDGTPLAFDIDTWNPEGESLVWVKLPSMEYGTGFAMFYRSSKSGKSVCGDNAFEDYVGVWHLGEAGNGVQDVLDASPNNLAAKSSDKSVAKSDGPVGGARQITTERAKADKAIKVTGTDAALAALNTLGTDFSVSFWARPIGALNNTAADAIGYDGLIGRKAAKTTPAWAIQLTDNVKKVRIWTSQTTDTNFGITGEIFQFAQNVWGKIDVVYTYATSDNQPRITAYWNGTKVYGPVAPWQTAVPAQGSLTLAIGGYIGSDERSFLGDMDEVRVSTILPTEDRVKADYDTVNVAAFLTAGTVTEFAEIPKPVAEFRLDDSGAAFAQFGGSISSLGEGAHAADVYYKVWPVGGTEPAAWTLMASGLEAGDSFEGIVTNLTPQVAYTNLLKAVNDLSTPYDSDIATRPFTTSGAGEAGTGGDAKRVGDSIVHTFTVDPNEGDTWAFVPPSYATSVEALVVAGGGPGGYYGGAGGGAGGLIYNDAFPVTGGATYTVKVGAGGIATSAATAYGTNGGDSLITSDSGATTNAIAYGGGAGGNGNLNGQSATRSGVSGGSGGGSTDATSPYVAGSGTSGQGNAGGAGLTTTDKNRLIGAGGGGAGGPGGTVSAGNTVSGGSGGDGRELRISGVAAVYAAGGGGGGRDNSDGNARGGPGAGGNGVGGDGGMFTVAGAGTERATAGKDGTGSGGGGGSTTAGAYGGANGGSGVVIVRYPIQGDGTAMPNPAIALTSASYDAETGVVSFTYRVAWAGYGYQVADVGIAWGYSPSALTTTNTVATDKIGSGSGTVQLPNVSKTVYLRAVATNRGGHADDSVETAVFTLFNPDAPVGTISVTDTGVTNAVFSVDVTDFGTGASSASVTVEVCTSEDFTGTVLSFPAAADLPSLGSVSVPATGLANNTAYYARAIVVNSEDVELTTDAIEFSTIPPGAPVGTAEETGIGFSTLSASVRVTNFGTGSDSATVRLEVSTASDFSTLAAVSEETAAALNTTLPLTASVLAPDTTFYRRVRIRNWWGVDTYVALPVTSTRSVPFSAAGPSWTASGDTVDLSLVVSAVYDSAECTAVLTYGGEEVGTQTFDEAGTVTWSGLAAKADGTVAQIVVTTTVDGADYSKTFSVPVTPGASATVVANVSVHASAANALWMRPGDVAMLPDLYGDALYEVLNERFARIDGSALTALEPGIVGVRCVDASFHTNVMGVVILPDAIGEGSVYVFDETKWTDDSWTKAASWKKVDGATRTAVASNDSWPCHADDIAILPFYNRAGDSYMRHRTDITLGGLYTGMIRPDATASCNLERFKDVDTKTVTFQRTDGQPVRLQVCPNGFNGNYQSQLQFGGYVIDVVWASDAVIDCGSSETEYTSGPVGTFFVKSTTPSCTNTLQGVTLTVRGLPGRYVNGAGSTREFNGIWKGTGTIVKEGQGGIVFHGDVGGFSGSFVVKGERNLGGMTVPATQLSLRGGGATNISATVYGVVAVSSNGSPTSNGGAGVFGTSTQVQAATPDRGPDAPAKGLSLFGGTWYAGRIDNKTWGKGAKDDKVVDFLSLGPGMSFVSLQPPQGNNGGYPINAVTVESLRQTERGTLAVYDKSRYAVVPQTETNSLFRVVNWTDFATGAEGYSVTGSVYPIIPWMISSMNDDWSNTAFASFDAEGRLVYPTRDNVQITEAAENANLYMTGKNLDYGTAGGDCTINSLYLSNGGNNRWLGEGRTLRIKSGGLILQGASAIGLPGRTDNGALVLGDATHPAYVWAKAYGSSTNYLGAAVTAAGGFVSAYPGNLCLVGDQTGIADEIAVNAGALALGTEEQDCSLADGLPIRVCRGAKLFLPKRNAVASNPLKFDGAGGAFGAVELPVDQCCASLLVRDVSESDAWTTLPDGTYGATGSGAENVRDDLFSGPGVLTVGASAAIPLPEDATAKAAVLDLMEYDDRIEPWLVELGQTETGLAAVTTFTGSTNALVTCYLVNILPDSNPEIELAIPSIAFDANGNPVVEGELLNHGAEVRTTVRGRLRLYYADALENLATSPDYVQLTPPALPVEATDDGSGSALPDARFYQFRIE